MKYYVASRSSLPERPAMWKAFREEGVEITSKWIDYDGSGVGVDFPALWQDIEQQIKDCDVLVFYAESDDFPFKGAMVEVGMAIAHGKKVRIVLKDVELEGLTFRPLGSWCMHPSVEFLDDVRTAVGL